ncbi:hypothetical protein ACIBQ1_10300 [Nonomuraea sp. NPDC050153]|uniref:hypothetical protein n=1 Tax=Nonomuraea sp. NPDC050153 TaxID=3364359 RepID=UPI0037B68BB6
MNLAETHVIPRLGKIKLQHVRADHVDEWLVQLSGKLATTTLREIHSAPKRAIRQAQARDMVLMNVAALVTTPTGTDDPARHSHGNRQRPCSRPPRSPNSTPTW